ncbi:RloB family protein [Paenibacillus algicola]|nr:RloB family protein [Paenibacillus algicola]
MEMVVTDIARLNPSVPRQIETRPSNLGKVLLICEGPTEVLYFEHFADIIRRNQNKFAHLDIESIPAKGNAQRVLNFAEEFLQEETNLRKYALYEKHLVFDCDAPTDIERVIIDMLSSTNNYILSLTNLLFETWLLMHFEQVEPIYSDTKTKVGNRLEAALGKEYTKADSGLIRQIIGNGDNLRNAISHAYALEERFKNQNLSLEKDIQKMNPFTTVHSLMERMLYEMERSET